VAAAAAYAPTFFAHEKDPFQGPKVQPAAVDTTAAEEAPQKKLKHNATVSSGAYMSCKLSVVADPNSTVYKQLTTEEVDTLLSRREFASNLLARGFVVYKKRDSMVYVFDHEGGIEPLHQCFECGSRRPALAALGPSRSC
jgi:hypothetical protein